MSSSLPRFAGRGILPVWQAEMGLRGTEKGTSLIYATSRWIISDVPFSGALFGSLGILMYTIRRREGKRGIKDWDWGQPNLEMGGVASFFGSRYNRAFQSEHDGFFW